MLVHALGHAFIIMFSFLFLGKVFFEISFSRELIILFRSFLEDL